MQEEDKILIMSQFGYPIEVEFIGYPSSRNYVEDRNRIWIRYPDSYWKNHSKRNECISIDRIIKNK